ncbi:hypothetical protein BCV69DRAFT_296838 [Microstroma glucosiphilum]|uniref:Ubiquitin-like protease family profile domain-containing protein n=1 Tax=Pseudomicrostroma glucosiphilum TaxID=1684307 RepID=A0A316UCE8_9BASI|nr:hypothetical protein BCV69DRAFT_296838 [Pseudomicrostroma glucosiphilum]PWN22866.1 hypothetical protein BCV69DRAFT_296838 [Pseudomicrostroma glucosiphilum]
MPSAKRANKAGPSNASSSSSSSAALRTSKSASTDSTASLPSPSKRVIASLRRFPSQLLSAFSSASPSTTSSSSKGKRKAEERERDVSTSTSSKGKARARDPPLDSPAPSSAVGVADESSSSPAQKRARIAAPEALGREESRRLLALLDSPARSERDWQMISVEEDEETKAAKRLQQDPAKDLEDDDEVAGLLGETGTKVNGEGSGKREPEPLPDRTAGEPQSADADATEPLNTSKEVNGVDKDQNVPDAAEDQESETAPNELGSTSAESASADISEQAADEPKKAEVTTSPKEADAGVQCDLPVTDAAGGESDAEARTESRHILPSQADVSMEEMVEEASAPISTATFPDLIATGDEPQIGTEAAKTDEEQAQVDELPTSMSEQERPEAADSILASGLPNGDVMTDPAPPEADETQPNSDPLKAATNLAEDSAGVEQAADAADPPSRNGDMLEGDQEAQRSDSNAPTLPSEDPAELQPDLQEASLPLSPPVVNGHVDPSPPLYPALPIVADLEIAQDVSSDSLSSPKKEEAGDLGLRVTSADALTEEIEPVENEMLEAEQPNFGQGIVDAVFTEHGQDAGLPGRAEAAAPGGEQEEAILIPAPSQEAETTPPPAENGVAEPTMELGEAEDIIVSSDTETDAPESNIPPLAGVEAGEGVILDGDELDEADEGEVEDEDIDELDEGSLLPTNPAVEVIDFTAEDSSDEEDEIVMPRPNASASSSTAFTRTPSNGLLRGPLSRGPRDAMSPVSNADSSVSDTIRALGRASLNPRSPSTASSMSAMFDAQRYHKPARKVTPSSHSAMAKRPHIFEASHKARVRGKAQKEIGALKVIFQKNAVWLSRKGFKTSEQLGGWLEYKKLLGERISTTTGPAREKTAVLQLLNNDGSDLERKLRRLLGKSATSDSRISIKPGKEQKRLRREALAKERLRRGILGRPPLPKTLTPEQEAQVAAVLSDYGWKVSVPGATASNRDVAMLRPGQWMNDETITFYMTMINQRSTRAEEERAKPNHEKRWNAFYRVHAFNSHFWAKIDQVGHSAVARWTRKIDVFSKDLILVPCNLGNSHWTCAAVNFRRKRIEYYDSMAGENRRVTSKLREYLKKEMADKKKDGVIDLNEFTDYFASDSSPQQRNGFDCGVFVCAALEQLSRRDPSHPSFDEDPPIVSLHSDDDEDEDTSDEEEEEEDDDDGDGYAPSGKKGRKRNRGDGYEWNFGQENMPYMRRRIIYEISQRALLD